MSVQSYSTAYSTPSVSAWSAVSSAVSSTRRRAGRRHGRAHGRTRRSSSRTARSRARTSAHSATLQSVAQIHCKNSSNPLQVIIQWPYSFHTVLCTPPGTEASDHAHHWELRAELSKLVALMSIASNRRSNPVRQPFKESSPNRGSERAQPAGQEACQGVARRVCRRSLDVRDYSVL